VIDWLTLRRPIDDGYCAHLNEKLLGAACVLVMQDLNTGEVQWEKTTFDFEKLRSDTPGLFWTVQTMKSQAYLVIGGSPASLEHGCNVFGSSDIRHCADLLIRHASRVLSCFLPTHADDAWQVRRIDVTHNYALPDPAAVKAALRGLLASDRARRFRGESAKTGDSVYWNRGSDLRMGKAYHKGPQLAFRVEREESNATPEQVEMADRLLRLELQLGRRWCERLTQKCAKGGNWVERDRDDPARRDWRELTARELDSEFETFFGGFFSDVEVSDMDTVREKLELVCPTKGRALAAHRTWAVIRAAGYEEARNSMPLRTFQLHTKYLREAGVSDMDMTARTVLPFRLRRINVAEPVTSWAELRRVA